MAVDIYDSMPLYTLVLALFYTKENPPNEAKLPSAQERLCLKEASRKVEYVQRERERCIDSPGVDFILTS